MERSVDSTTGSRFRTLLAGAAAPWEVFVVAVVAAIAWRITLGWDWSSVPTADPVRTTAPQTDLDWLGFGVVVATGVGWLARRGCPVAGAAAIWTPIVVLSGWRLAAAGTLGWPISLASLIFVASAICIVAASAGAWMRHRAHLRARATDDTIAPDDRAPQLPIVSSRR
jgi:hypothetical protein